MVAIIAQHHQFTLVALCWTAFSRNLVVNSFYRPTSALMIPWRTALSRALNAPRSFPDCFQAKERKHGGHKWGRQWSHFSRASNQLTRLGDWRLAQRSLTHSPLTGFNPLRHALDPFAAWNSDASFFSHQKSLNSTKHREYLQEHNIVILSIFHSFDLHAGARDFFSFLGHLEEYVRILIQLLIFFLKTFLSTKWDTAQLLGLVIIPPWHNVAECLPFSVDLSQTFSQWALM